MGHDQQYEKRYIATIFHLEKRCAAGGLGGGGAPFLANDSQILPPSGRVWKLVVS